MPQIVDYYYDKVNTGKFPNVAGWYATIKLILLFLLKLFEHVAYTDNIGTLRT